MSNIKYKVNELAKDLGLQTKEIVEVLGKYFDTPKKSGQNLEEGELNLVFEYLTQHNQISGIEVIFAEAAAAEQAKEQPKAAEPKSAEPKAETRTNAPAPAAKPQQQPQNPLMGGATGPRAPQQPVQQPQQDSRGVPVWMKKRNS